MNKSVNIILLSSVSLFSVGLNSQAEDINNIAVLEEVIVTAQKREQSLQDVPISVSAVQGKKIQDFAIRDFEGLSLSVPNFTVSRNAIQDTIAMRGINSDGQAGSEQSVGIYMDGLFRGRGIQSRFAFMDLERVEILRGPQGTLFGKNTIAGALNLTSARPTEKLEGSLSALYELEHQELEVQGHLSGPISDNIRGRVAFMVRDMKQGWIHNVAYDEDTPTSSDWAVRGSLDWDVSETLSLYLRYEHGNISTSGLGYDQYVIGDSLAAAVGLFQIPDVAAGFDGSSNIGNNVNQLALFGIPDAPAMDIGTELTMEGKTDEIMVNATYDAGHGTVTAIFGHSQYDFQRVQDADFNPLPAVYFSDAEDYDQQSMELRYVSDWEGDLQLIAGGYWQQSDLKAINDSRFNFPFLAAFQCLAAGAPTTCSPLSLLGVPSREMNLDQTSNMWAAFSQVTWTINDDLRLVGGLRYSEVKKEASHQARIVIPGTDTLIVEPFPDAFMLAMEVEPHDISAKLKETSTSPQIQLQWDANDDIMLYSSWTRGFKGGGYNSFALSTSLDDFSYDPEKADSFEIGSKMTLADGAARLNINYFYMNFTNLQTTQFTGNTGFVVTNAASARSQGIELEGQWRINENLQLSGNLAWLDFSYKNFSTAGCTQTQIQDVVAGNLDGEFTFDPDLLARSPAAACAAAGVNDLTGKTNQDAPEFTANLSVDYSQPVMTDYELRFRLTANYSGPYFAASDLDPATVQGKFVKLDGLVTFGPQDGQWDISLLAKNITNQNTFAYANDMPLFAGSHTVAWQRPRTIALRARVNF